MATTTFNIYKSTDGMLRLDNYTATYPNQDWEQFLQETGQTDRLERLNAMRSRNRSPRVCRLRKSEPFKQWQQGKTITVTSELYGVATADYDGRLPEGSIKYAILNAIRNGETEARYYPRSNANKPAHMHMVYVFDFQFDKKMSRYKLQQSTQQPGWWVLTDKDNGIVCRFKEHQFNETQQMTFLEDVKQPDATAIARLMREMGDWLAQHHYNIAMPPVPFCIQQTDDDTAQYLERGKYPRFRVIIDEECTAHELANALHKAAEYLHKRSGKGGIG